MVVPRVKARVRFRVSVRVRVKLIGIVESRIDDLGSD